MNNFEKACLTACENQVNSIKLTEPPVYSKKHKEKIELIADGKAEAETVTQSAENDPKTQVRTMAPAVLSGAALVIVLEALAFGIYRKKKGRRLR